MSNSAGGSTTDGNPKPRRTYSTPTVLLMEGHFTHDTDSRAPLRRLSSTREGHMSGRVWEHPSQPFVNQSAPHLAGSMYANRNNNEDSTEEHHEITDAEQSQPRLVC